MSSSEILFLGWSGLIRGRNSPAAQREGMRRSFLHADRDTFTPDTQAAVLTLAKAEAGTCLSDDRPPTKLGRTAAMRRLTQRPEDGTLYSVHDKARRHLRYHFDGFDLDPAEMRPELEPLLLSTLAIAPATATQLAAELQLPVPQIKATLEDMRARGVVFGPRAQGARVYRAGVILAETSTSARHTA